MRVSPVSRTSLALTHLRFRQNKYNATKTQYGGRTYHSKREAEYARTLDLLMSARGDDRVEHWEPQFRIPLLVNDQKICDFIPDFFVRYANGRKVLVEIKGMQTAEYRIKLKLFRATWLADHPDIEYVINP